MGAAGVSLDLGFDVKSCNWCEAALPARINFYKSINTIAFISHRFISLSDN